VAFGRFGVHAAGEDEQYGIRDAVYRLGGGEKLDAVAAVTESVPQLPGQGKVVRG